MLLLLGRLCTGSCLLLPSAGATGKPQQSTGETALPRGAGSEPRTASPKAPALGLAPAAACRARRSHAHQGPVRNGPAGATPSAEHKTDKPSQKAAWCVRRKERKSLRRWIENTQEEPAETGNSGELQETGSDSES